MTSPISKELQEKLNEIHKEKMGYDSVHRPSHYQGKVECIDAIESAVEGLEGIEAVCVANIIKYVWRFKKKNKTEDLQKSLWYLNKLISLQESDRELS
jgi:hypothetical protein